MRLKLGRHPQPSGFIYMCTRSPGTGVQGPSYLIPTTLLARALQAVPTFPYAFLNVPTLSRTFQDVPALSGSFQRPPGLSGPFRSVSALPDPCLHLDLLTM